MSERNTYSEPTLAATLDRVTSLMVIHIRMCAPLHHTRGYKYLSLVLVVGVLDDVAASPFHLGGLQDR